MIGVLQGDDMNTAATLGGYRLRIKFSEEKRTGRMPGGGFIINIAPDEFLVAGHGFGVDFAVTQDVESNVDFLWLDEGDYQQGKWIPGRRLNGDEYVLRLPSTPTVRRAKLYRYR